MGKVRNFAAEKIQQELIAGHAKWHSEGLLYLFFVHGPEEYEPMLDASPTFSRQGRMMLESILFIGFRESVLSFIVFFSGL